MTGNGGVTISQVIIITAIVWMYIHPFVSKKVRGWQRFNWFILTLFFSVIGYVAYYVFGILLRRKKEPFTWPSTTSEQWIRR